MTGQQKGIGLGVAAYTLWGFAPAYWPLIDGAGPVEVLAHRVVWSLFVVALLLTITRAWSRFRAIWRSPRTVAMLTLAAAVVSVNWGLFIYGVTHDKVIETSLGYFINPLMTVLLAVLLLGERMRPTQWAAVALGAVAVVVIAADYGRLPYVALGVAVSFAIYGFVKKSLGLGSAESMGAETLISLPFALGYLVVLQVQGQAAFAHEGVGQALLLMGAGVVTVVPLLLFNGAAIRLPLSTVGLLQYLGPLLQFVLGLTLFHESMSTARWVGFVLVWSALVVFTVDALRNRRRTLRETAEAAAV